MDTSSSGRRKREVKELDVRRKRQVANLDKQREVICEPLGNNGEINYWKYEYEVPKYCWSEYLFSFFILYIEHRIHNLD